MDALERVVAGTGVDDLVSLLAGLPGPDLTTLLLAVSEARVARRSPAAVLRQATADRFVQTSTLDGRALHQLEATLLAALPEAFEVVVLSPVAPFGACAALATVSQHKVVTTIRRSEVAADPTNVLAIEAARRRRAGQRDPIHLAALQRVVRAQRFEGASAHFGLLGLVTATRGDDAGALAHHAQVLVDLATDAGATDLELAVTDLGAGADLEVRGAAVRDAPERTSGRGYYRDTCFKLHGTVDGERWELGDGGCTDWTARLLADRRERTVISGLGVERLLAR